MPNSILTFDQKLLLNQIGEEIKIGLPGEEAQNKLAPQFHPKANIALPQTTIRKPV